MHLSHASSKGAFGLDLSDGKGGMEMIDAPLIKQAEQTIRLAKAVGLDVPTIEWDVKLSNTNWSIIFFLVVGGTIMETLTSCLNHIYFWVLITFNVPCWDS